jgi:trans-aconitate 2-methyltransferase
MTQTDAWNPAQYEKFRDERMQPFFDLVALIQPAPNMRVIDLGCGTGELTAMLAERLPGASVEGVDSSPAMLDQAVRRASERVRFAQRDIAAIDDFSAYDLVFSNAALQWVPDNEGLMHRLFSSLRPGGQVAIQVPKNEAHPSHSQAEQVARDLPYRELLHGYVRRTEALELERYATLLYEHSFEQQVCIEKIYGHGLASTDDVVEWVKGTSLAAYLTRLEEPHRSQFEAEYRRRLSAAIGARSPYFYPFRRLLFWGRKAA